MTTFRLTCDSPLGPVTLSATADALIGLDWHGGAAAEPATPVLAEARRQLAAYFAGTLRRFDLPLAPAGTAHQQKVWRAIARIPFGGHRTYGALAAALGSSPRAVGTACGRNPIPIIIPCHRVLARGGGLGGYSGTGGTATKRYLLSLEGVGFNE